MKIEAEINVMFSNKVQQGQKLLKKESNVGMMLTGIQRTKTSCM